MFPVSHFKATELNSPVDTVFVRNMQGVARIAELHIILFLFYL
jgi:hypothetical protein